MSNEEKLKIWFYFIVKFNWWINRIASEICDKKKRINSESPELTKGKDLTYEYCWISNRERYCNDEDDDGDDDDDFRKES